MKTLTKEEALNSLDKAQRLGVQGARVYDSRNGVTLYSCGWDSNRNGFTMFSKPGRVGVFSFMVIPSLCGGGMATVTLARVVIS
jgi:hypothetical protein